MKLSDKQALAFTLLLNSDQTDPILSLLRSMTRESACNALEQIPSVAGSAVGSIDRTIVLLTDLRGVLVPLAPSGLPETPETPSAERIVAWLQEQQKGLPGDKKHTPAEIRTALEMPQGTFGDALKSLRENGVIMAEGQGAGRRIWLVKKA